MQVGQKIESKSEHLTNMSKGKGLRCFARLGTICGIKENMKSTHGGVTFSKVADLGLQIY